MAFLEESGPESHASFQRGSVRIGWTITPDAAFIGALCPCPVGRGGKPSIIRLQDPGRPGGPEWTEAGSSRVRWPYLIWKTVSATSLIAV